MFKMKTCNSNKLKEIKDNYIQIFSILNSNKNLHIKKFLFLIEN